MSLLCRGKKRRGRSDKHCFNPVRRVSFLPQSFPSFVFSFLPHLSFPSLIFSFPLHLSHSPIPCCFELSFQSILRHGLCKLDSCWRHCYSSDGNMNISVSRRGEGRRERGEGRGERGEERGERREERGERKERGVERGRTSIWKQQNAEITYHSHCLESHCFTASFMSNSWYLLFGCCVVLRGDI